MKYIVALDPGGDTGLAWRDDEDDIRHAVLEFDEHHRALWDFLDGMRPDVVVCERFVYVARQKVDLTAVEYIGVAKIWCKLNSALYVPQNRDQAKNLWTDVKLEQLQLKPANKHARDAMRHLLLYLTSEGEHQYIAKATGH